VLGASKADKEVERQREEAKKRREGLVWKAQQARAADPEAAPGVRAPRERQGTGVEARGGFEEEDDRSYQRAQRDLPADGDDDEDERAPRRNNLPRGFTGEHDRRTARSPRQQNLPDGYFDKDDYDQGPSRSSGQQNLPDGYFDEDDDEDLLIEGQVDDWRKGLGEEAVQSQRIGKNPNGYDPKHPPDDVKMRQALFGAEEVLKSWGHTKEQLKKHAEKTDRPEEAEKLRNYQVPGAKAIFSSGKALEGEYDKVRKKEKMRWDGVGKVQEPNDERAFESWLQEVNGVLPKRDGKLAGIEDAEEAEGETALSVSSAKEQARAWAKLMRDRKKNGFFELQAKSKKATVSRFGPVKVAPAPEKQSKAALRRAGLLPVDSA